MGVFMGNNMEDVFNYLDNLNINYETVNHPAAFTTLDADKYIEGMEGVRSKTMFMAGKKDRNFYLFIMDENKRLDIKKLSNLIDDRLHFGREEDLFDKMGLVPGMVSLFGLLNNSNHDIKVYIDKCITLEKIITFHPNDNTATVFISINDMFKILDDLEYNYELLDL